MAKHKNEFLEPTKIRGIGTAQIWDSGKNKNKLFFMRPVLNACLINFAKRITKVLELSDKKMNVLAYRELQISGCLGGAFEDYRKGSVVIPERPFYRKLHDKKLSRGHLDFWMWLPSGRVDKKQNLEIGLEFKTSFHAPSGLTEHFGERLAKRWNACVTQIHSLTDGAFRKHRNDDRQIKVALHLIIVRDGRSQGSKNPESVGTLIEKARKLRKPEQPTQTLWNPRSPNWVGACLFYDKWAEEIDNPYGNEKKATYLGFVLAAYVEQYGA